MKKLITFLLLLFLLPQRVQAAEADESALAAVESAAGVDGISEPDGYDKTTDGGKKDLLSSSLTVIQNTLTGVFGDVSGTLFLLLATVLLAALHAPITSSSGLTAPAGSPSVSVRIGER